MNRRTLIAGIATVASLIAMTPTVTFSADQSVVMAEGTNGFLTEEQIVTARYDFDQRGSDVRRLQNILKIKTDGIYGPVTWARHRAYLIDHNYNTKILPNVPDEFTDVWYPVKYKKETVRLPLDKSKRCIQYEDEFREYGLPVDIFSYVSWRESRCEIRAVGWNYKQGMSHLDCAHRSFENYLRTCKAVSSFDSGLLQVNSSWYSLTRKVCGATPQEGALFSLDCNLRVSKRILMSSSRPMSNWGF